MCCHKPMLSHPLWHRRGLLSERLKKRRSQMVKRQKRVYLNATYLHLATKLDILHIYYHHPSVTIKSNHSWLPQLLHPPSRWIPRPSPPVTATSLSPTSSSSSSSAPSAPWAAWPWPFIHSAGHKAYRDSFTGEEPLPNLQNPRWIADGLSFVCLFISSPKSTPNNACRERERDGERAREGNWFLPSSWCPEVGKGVVAG